MHRRSRRRWLPTCGLALMAGAFALLITPTSSGEDLASRPDVAVASPPAERVATAPDSLDLATFLDLVRRRHPRFRQLALAGDVARAERRRLPTVQDWRLEIGPGWSYREPIETSAFAPRMVESVSISAGVERPFWATGGRFFAGWRASWTEQDLPTVAIPGPGGAGATTIETGPGTLHRSGVSVRYAQPLWRNLGGDLDRLEYRAAGHSVTLAGLRAREEQESFLLEIASQYLDWVRWERSVTIAAERLRIAREQTALVEAKLARNLVDRVDLLRARDAEVLARSSLVRVRAEREAERRALSVLAGLDDLAGHRPVDSLTEPVALAPPETVFASLRDRARILRMVEQQQARLAVRQDGARGRGEPDLSLDLDLGLQGGDRDGHLASWEVDRPDLQVGLTFRQQLGAGSAEAERDELAVRARRLGYLEERTARDLRAAILRLHARLEGMAELLMLDRRRVDLASRKAAAERELYREGRNPLNFVLQAQQAEQGARQTLVDDGAAYHRLLQRYRALTDQLLVESR
ncbi:hypothetical protein GF314_16500 [bacterium]|nr:hypothetical protein [bacterium]